VITIGRFLIWAAATLLAAVGLALFYAWAARTPLAVIAAIVVAVVAIGVDLTLTLRRRARRRRYREAVWARRDAQTYSIDEFFALNHALWDDRPTESGAPE
jgi:hypothetical protein